MKLLVLGGTKFVGRHIVEAALARGHAVTLFNRGTSGAGLFPGVETLTGDRGGDHAALARGSWDAVADVSNYRPGEIRSAVARLRGRAGRYVLISTVSVYKDYVAGGTEDAATWEPADASVTEVGPKTYGPLKRACELALERDWNGPSVTVRLSVVAGPYDDTDRFTYWPVRAARGGRVLAPLPDKTVQYVDARDAAAWVVAAAGGAADGVFNVAGPERRFGDVLKECARAAGTAPEFVETPDDALLANKLTPFTDLPLWIPAAVRSFSPAKAEAAGLRARAVFDTASDILRWRRESGAPDALKAGLSPERESEVLASLAVKA